MLGVTRCADLRLASCLIDDEALWVQLPTEASIRTINGSRQTVSPFPGNKTWKGGNDRVILIRERCVSRIFYIDNVRRCFEVQLTSTGFTHFRPPSFPVKPWVSSLCSEGKRSVSRHRPVGSISPLSPS
jgi:hypothetical protein